jgi:tetratricopeptide (TPR) repeat protein
VARARAIGLTCWRIDEVTPHKLNTEIGRRFSHYKQHCTRVVGRIEVPGVMNFRGAHTTLVVASLLLIAKPGLRQAAQKGSKDAETLKHHIAVALSNYHAKRYKAAQKQLEMLAREFPANFEVNELLGLVYSAQGEFSKATEPLESAVRLKPDSAPARVSFATVLVQCGRTSRALEELHKAVELAPEDFEANHTLGIFYARSGEAHAAIPYLEKAQRIKPASYSNGYELALAYVNAQELAPARHEIQDLLAGHPTAELYSLLGEVEEKSGNYAEAANALKRAALLDPSEENLFEWSDELLVHRQPIPATDAFKRGIQQYPHSARLWVGLGIALYARSDYQGAIRALLRAIDLRPQDPRSYFFLANAYTLAFNIPDGVGSQVAERMGRLKEANPQNAQVLFYYALCLWKQKGARGRQESLGQVESLLSESARLDSSFPRVHLELGMLYQSERRSDEAIHEFQQAIQLDPNLGPAHYRLGQLYMQTRQRELAEQEFQTSKRLHSQKNPEADQRVGDIERFLSTMKVPADRP